MTSNAIERKLVAIVSADVAGYSRLMSIDEEDTVRRLTSHRETIGTIVEKHRGRVVDNPGDNALLEFPSATDAVECATEIQETISNHNADIDTELRMEFRMGIHLGEVMVEDERIYGEGVNVAARLEAMAPVGGIVVSQSVRDQMASSVATDLQDLGLQPLKNIPQPIHVYRVQTGVEEPGWTAPRLKNNLPADMSTLVGREEAVGEIGTLLKEARLVTLVGSGGIGKTRLGIAAARALMPDFPDGVWFIDLTNLETGDLLLPGIAEVLNVEPPALRSIEEALLDATRDITILLVLDNCEHLVEAAAHAATVLLRGSPGVHVLATSQELLQITGEMVLQVPNLGLPEPEATVEAIEASAAVDLFRQRAQAAEASFEITSDNAAVVASICRHLDGIPLAIELAAARVRSLAPIEIDARLAETFDILTGGGRDVLPRHQTLRATIEWSYDHLDDQAQSFFEKLGVFAGSFTREAASVVAGLGDDETADAIEGLVARSLLQTTVGPERRFRLLETLRLFAMERHAQAGALDGTRSRHLDWIATLTQRETPKLMTGDQLEALAELRGDVDDLRAALRWSLDSRQTGVGLRIATSLARFWYLSAMHREGAEWLERLLAATHDVSPLDMGKALSALAMTLVRIGRSDEAAEKAAEAVNLLEGLDEPRALGWAKYYLAVATTEPGYGNAEDVERLYKAAFSDFKEAAYRPGMALATLLLGAIAARRDANECLGIIEPLLKAADDANNANLMAHCLEFVAGANQSLEAMDKVVPAYSRAIRLHTEIGNWACLCHAFEGLTGYLVADHREIEGARIVGGTDTLRTNLSTVQAPYERFLDIYDWIDAIGDRPELAAARLEGRQWTREELVTQALEYLKTDS